MLNVGGRKQSDFNKTPENFTHSVGVIMYSYALVSAGAPPGNILRTLDAARSHNATVEHYSRLITAAGGPLGGGVMDVEMALRSQWVVTRHIELNLSLSDVVTIVSQSNLWPLNAEFRETVRTPTNDRGWQPQQKGVLRENHKLIGHPATKQHSDVITKGSFLETRDGQLGKNSLRRCNKLRV